MFNTLNIEIVLQYTFEYLSKNRNLSNTFVNDLGDIKSKAQFSFLPP